MNSVLYVAVALGLALIVLLSAVLFAPRCTAETNHPIKVGGMLLAGCER